MCARSRLIEFCKIYKKGTKKYLTLYVTVIVFRSILVFSDNLCVTTDKVTESDCYAVSRQDSEVQCLHVSDSAECAIRLTEGKADFAVFNAEELLLAHKFGPFHSLVPILQLRHKDKQDGVYKSTLSKRNVTIKAFHLRYFIIINYYYHYYYYIFTIIF